MKPLLAAVAIFALTSPVLAGSIQKMTPCMWEALFRQSTINCEPLGLTRGKVLYADGMHPRLKAHLEGIVWKGKNFHGDATFTNRWLGGIQAGSTDVRVEASWLDGQSCLVMQYAPNALAFGNVRDELRQIEPNVWLGRSYDAASGQAKNWFVLRGK